VSYVRDITAPITQALLAENMNFALAYPISTKRTVEVELYFFRITRTFPLIKVLSTELPKINAGSTASFNYVGDIGFGSGTDIFEIPEEYPWRIYHFGMGIAPSYIKVYKAIPSGYVNMGWARKVPTKEGEEYDYVDVYLSPYDNPTVASETVIHRRLSFTMAVKNDSAIAVRPSIKLLGKAYEVMPINNKNIIELMIAGKIPCRYVTIGGLGTFPYSVPDEWSGYGVRLDATTFQDIMNRMWR